MTVVAVTEQPLECEESIYPWDMDVLVICVSYYSLLPHSVTPPTTPAMHHQNVTYYVVTLVRPVHKLRNMGGGGNWGQGGSLVLLSAIYYHCSSRYTSQFKFMMGFMGVHSIRSWLFLAPYQYIYRTAN